VYQNSYSASIGKGANFVFFTKVFNISAQKVTCCEHSSLELGSLLTSRQEIVFEFAGFC